jgi:hypothetical protein
MQTTPQPPGTNQLCARVFWFILMQDRETTLHETIVRLGIDHPLFPPAVAFDGTTVAKVDFATARRETLADIAQPCTERLHKMRAPKNSTNAARLTQVLGHFVEG